jgi:hypothetical protein
MPTSKATREPVVSSWNEFEAEFGAHPAMSADVVYAIPMPLIDSIVRYAPAVFDKNDIRFEQALSTSGFTGIFRWKPFFSELLTEAGASTSDARQKSIDTELRTLIESEIVRSGSTTDEVEQYFSNEVVDRQRSVVTQKSYLGWLLTDPLFRSERDAFCATWRTNIQDDGKFPSIQSQPMGVGGRENVHRRLREYHSETMQFFRRWGLKTFLTWELPIPLPAGLMNNQWFDPQDVSDAGVTVFLPWYVVRDRDLSLADIASHRRLLAAPNHLAEWLDRETTNWGTERFATMFELYVYLELALRSRYGDRLNRQTGKLDLAFASYRIDSTDSLEVDRESETIRKIRQKMNKRIKASSQ